MLVTKLKGQITAKRQLRVKIPPSVAPGEVEIILLHERATEPDKTAASRGRRKAVNHPAYGIWSDRDDIKNADKFAASLRRKLETRADRNGK